MTSTHLPQGVACTIPPAGWHCTRAPGHDGPCAAHPTETAWEGPLTDKETAMLESAWQKHKDSAPPTPATDAREAVARAMYECDPMRVDGPPSWDKDSDEIERAIYLRDADAALSALAPIRAAEILAAEANERARIVAWLRVKAAKYRTSRDEVTDMDVREHCDSSYLAHTIAANEIERNEHGAGK